MICLQSDDNGISNDHNTHAKIECIALGIKKLAPARNGCIPVSWTEGCVTKRRLLDLRLFVFVYIFFRRPCIQGVHHRELLPGELRRRCGAACERHCSNAPMPYSTQTQTKICT